jgi:hypothetical protein
MAGMVSVPDEAHAATGWQTLARSIAMHNPGVKPRGAGLGVSRTRARYTINYISNYLTIMINGGMIVVVECQRGKDRGNDAQTQVLGVI